ncbi:MAG: response regulator transcription factor [Lachnospiraceae bacterium]|nr:response regulator transcription factor [Lachnospiraceae bacterium]
MSYKVLLVEDNPHIMEINHEALMMADYDVLEAFDGKQCMEQLRSGDVDLVVLDIMLPDSDGITLCRQIKQNYDVPILFLSALGENEQIIRALREGGDDYMTKPYDLGVLLAHVEARLRDSQSKKRIIYYDGLKLDTVAMVAFFGEVDLLLTKKEFSLLMVLATRGTHPLSKEELCQYIWNSSAQLCCNALYTTISRLNKKLLNAGVELTAEMVGNDGYILTEI